MKVRIILIQFLMIIPLVLLAENYSDEFLYMNTAIGYGNIKDSGTSPLRYHGTSAEIIGGYIHNTSINNFEILGCFSATVGFAKSYILNLYQGVMDISYMHNFPITLNEKTDFRMGLNLYSSTKIINNSSYQNASFNFDMFVKLALRAQIQHQIDVKKKTIHVLGIKFNIKNQIYSPFFRIDIPALIFNGRPEYAYVNENELGVFDRHYFFGGYDLKSQLGIKKHLINGNLLELAYVFHMHSTGKKDIYFFEEASHNLAFSLYFKLN